MSSFKAVLALEDGSKFFGFGFGFPSKVCGEVVFNTGMVGYPEALTDPSYSGQILVQTYPLIGNYGVPSKARADSWGLHSNLESEKIQVKGYIVHEHSVGPSHRTSEKSLDQWLREERIPAISGIDTRRLTKKLRIKGTMLGILEVGEEIDENALEEKIHEIPDPSKMDLVGKVTIKEPTIYSAGSTRIVMIDCGVKLGILRNLLLKGATVVRVPYNLPFHKVMDYQPHGVVVSNGPGDPKMCGYPISTIRKLIAADVPMLGICLGNQLLALASGGDTYKLKFGHRGQNHPCLHLPSGRCYITSQNHGFAVDNQSLEDTGLEPSFVNINDHTNEGIKYKSKPIFGIQFHPEASPGPLDTGFMFDDFLHEVEKCRF